MASYLPREGFPWRPVSVQKKSREFPWWLNPAGKNPRSKIVPEDCPDTFRQSALNIPGKAFQAREKGRSHGRQEIGPGSSGTTYSNIRYIDKNESIVLAGR